MNTIDKILMIDSIYDEIAELINHIDNAKSKAAKEHLEKELEMKRQVLEGFKCSLADDIVASTLYADDDEDEDEDELCDGCCEFCDDPCDEIEGAEGFEEDEGNVALLRKVAELISHAADCIEENGKVSVSIE